MTTEQAPKWLNSPYVYQDEDGKYFLKDDAPEDIKKAYKEYWNDEN